MHPALSQRRAILEGLRERARRATAEFYQKPNMIAPPLAPRYIVKPTGNNIFDVIERSTGKIITERLGHNNATGHALKLEEKAGKVSVKQLARALSIWTLSLGATLAALVFISSGASGINNQPLTQRKRQQSITTPT